MTLRARMHPRNIYKTPPNFRDLAIEFPEFRKYVKQELSGRMSLDYSDRKSVSELAKLLLLKDFDLRVEINETRLIPRVPLCLNYLLWVEDLIATLNKSDDVRGIDIGTGSVCIYSLLASRKGWKMLATEIDKVSFQCASENVKRNNLNESIELRFVEKNEKVLEDVIDDNVTYDFCMCNPPFFDNDEKPRNRTLRRKIIENTVSNISTDFMTKGGEVEFVKKIIEESILLKEKIKIYTTLIGKKCDFNVIKQELNRIDSIVLAETEFCQGNTTRWGIAWSYLDINIKEVSNDYVNKQKKTKAKILTHSIATTECQFNQASEIIAALLQELQISFKKEEINDMHSFSLEAYENTWSHQRRKKRQIKLEHGKAQSEEIVASTGSDDLSESSDPPSKKVKLTNDKKGNIFKTKLVECLLVLRKEENNLMIEMSWLSGHKESVHQIFQYLKNNFNDQMVRP